MWLYALLVIYLSLSRILADAPYRRVVRQAVYGRLCTTPDNKSGACVPLKSCDYLYQLLLTDGRNPTSANFLRKSQCDQLFENGMPVVCCTDKSASGNTVPRPASTTARPASTTARPASTTTRPTNQRPTTTAATANINYGECGKSERKETRIVGGKNSTLGDWPWMVALGYRSASRPTLDFKCGATLISNKWVITAAHCVQNLGNFQLTTARLGDLDLDPNAVDNATPVDAPIDEIIPHPEYTSNPITNDVALLRLKDTVKFSKFIRPICLLSGSQYRSDTFYSRKRPFIIGWGAVEWRGAASTLLQEATISIVNNTDCANTYAQQRSAKIDQRVLCAGEKGRDTCQGDSGGPLIFPVTEGHYYLGGIVSFGVKCADLTFPGVYTRVAAFTDWISQTTGLDV